MNAASFDDTIAAVATPRGRSALAVIRVSGPRAREILLEIAPSLRHSPEALVPRRQHLLAVHHPHTGELLDRALATYFPAPNSYTGEEAVEVSTHGGDIAPQLVLDALLAAGSRLALPGEFTRRAVLNGKLDLLQAEAVGDVIDARSPAFHRAALHQIERGLSGRIDELRERIIEVEALISYGIDFPDEDEPPVPPQRILSVTEEALDQLRLVIGTAPQGQMLRRGALVVLAGLPNSGKSSLFNALLGAERAIVTEIAGTTRDAIEADTTLAGYPFRLVDTAGLRETNDRVEALGVEVARRYLASADMILFCSEAGRPLVEEEVTFLARVQCDAVLIRTKTDLGRSSARSAPGSIPVLELSVESGDGLGALRDHLVRASFGPALEAGDTPIVTSERQLRALRQAEQELRSFREAFGEGLPPELAATHLRAATEFLEELIGAVTPDHVLGAIFNRFCVGK